MAIEPLTIKISEEKIEDLRSRLKNAKLAPDFNNSDWRYGTNRDYLESFIQSWIDYDWSATENEINSFANYTTTIEDLPIHFIYERGEGTNPMPLILSHGWPWTFWDYEKVIRPLTNPSAFGGNANDAFDVIVPSLPGFGFSTPLTTDGVQAVMTTDIWHRLMSEELGYERYAVGGGDFGAMIAQQLGQRHPEHVIGVYLTMASGARRSPEQKPDSAPPSTLETLLPLINGPTSRLNKEDFAPEETDWYEHLETRWASALSHVAVHTNDPQTLAYALHDSPVGLAAWLLERRRNWSDNNGNIEEAFSRKFLMDLVSIYWLTDSFFTSARWYWHTFRAKIDPPKNPTLARETPLGIAVSPKDLVYTPKKMVEENANLIHWTEHPRGGHFGPAEEPELFIEDIRKFFQKLR